MGISLEWRELPNKKASRIIATHPVDFEDIEKWEEQFDRIIDVAMKMRRIFKKYM